MESRKRPRVSVACDDCKRMKKKCDGLKPCSLCSQKGFNCIYTSKKDSPAEVNSLNLTLWPLNNKKILKLPGDHLHMVCGTCTLCLIEQTRSLLGKFLGTSTFIENLQNWLLSKIEERVVDDMAFILPSRKRADKLIDLFVEYINNVYYVLDMDKFLLDLNEAYSPSGISNPSKTCIMSLVFALGTLISTHIYNTNDNNDFNEEPISSEKFFNHGSSLLKKLSEVGNIQTVEAFMLSGLYYEVTARGYDSWNQLGKAIRYAQNLSLDLTIQDGANEFFSLNELQQRNSIWLTLYIQDHLKSMFLGRPLMMIDEIGYIKVNDYYTHIRYQFAKLCKILQDIQYIYKKGTISVSIAQRIKARLKVWNGEYRMIKNDIEETEENDLLRKCTKLQLLINLSYYYGMILLTKPFLSHIVFKRGELKEEYNKDQAIEDLSITCVQSSIHSIRTIMTSFYEKGSHLPRSPLVIYCAFTSGVILLLDAFNSRLADCRFDEIESWAIANCLQLLSRYSTYDIYAKRYLTVLIELITVVIKGWKGYDNKEKLAEFGVTEVENQNVYELIFPKVSERNSHVNDNEQFEQIEKFDYFDLNMENFDFLSSTFTSR